MKTLEELMALAVHLEALADPEQEAVPSYENTDWRGLANTCAHALRELIADAERWQYVLERNADGSPTRAREFTELIDAWRKG